MQAKKWWIYKTGWHLSRCHHLQGRQGLVVQVGWLLCEDCSSRKGGLHRSAGGILADSRQQRSPRKAEALRLHRPHLLGPRSVFRKLSPPTALVAALGDEAMFEGAV